MNHRKAHEILSQLSDDAERQLQKVLEDNYDFEANRQAAKHIEPFLRIAVLALSQAAHIATRCGLPLLLFALLIPAAASAQCPCLADNSTPAVYRLEMGGKILARCKYQGGCVWIGQGTDGRIWEVHQLGNVGAYRGGRPTGWGGGMYFGPPMLAINGMGFTHLAGTRPVPLGVNGRGTWTITTPAPFPQNITVRAE